MALRKNNESAFTLLELLAAMALMGVLAASLYASLHIAFGARARVDAALEPVWAVELAIELLRADIEAALPPTGVLAGAFIGLDVTDEAGRDADTLLFHSSAQSPELSARTCDIRKVELACAPLADQTQRALVRRITTKLLATEVVTPQEEVLCRAALGLNLRYFDGSEWLDSWDSTVQDNALPLAVELTLELEPPEATEPPARGYRLSRVLLLRCSSLAADQGTQIIRPSAR